jgi:chromate transporter
MLLELFFTFFMIGLVSFGGGYAMIALIQEEVVVRHGWMTVQEFTNVIAVAGMSPGPIATNSAIFIGYAERGIPGAAVAAMGMILPSLIIILIIGAVFYKVQQNYMIKSAFYGLRAIITGLIIYAAILFAGSSNLYASFTWQTASLLIIYAASLTALIRFKIHPVYVILGSGLVGVAFYS